MANNKPNQSPYRTPAKGEEIPSVGVNDFVRRQTIGSEFTHFDDDSKSLNDGEEEWDKVVALVREHFHEAKPGYREGVCLVPVPGENFFCGVVELREGDQLVGEYKARRPGEEPRKSVRVKRERFRRPGPGAIERGADPSQKIPIPGSGKARCTHVDIVLYSRHVLEEGGEDNTGNDWDIIAVNGRTSEEEQPIHPDTLIANHFELDGGTATGMSPEEFEAALRESVLFWKNKAMLAALL